jgi:tryptophan-rich sensory protein
MGYASYLVYRDGGGLMSGAAARMPLALYASQLALNWAWTPLFFGKHDLRSSFYEICALWLNIAACGLSFYAVNRTAGCLSSFVLHVFQPSYSRTVLWIRDILVRIRIRGCVPLTNGSGSGSCYFSS